MSADPSRDLLEAERAWRAHAKDPQNQQKRAALIKSQKKLFVVCLTEGGGASKKEARRAADIIFGSGAGILMMEMALEPIDDDLI